MRGAKRYNDGELTQTPKKMQNQSAKVTKEMYESSPASGSRCSTRSQAYPDWTKLDSLILVNEIAAIERDCMTQLSSYQKWKLVADNCTALEVLRNSHQCHRKWDLLLAEYNMIKQYDAKSTGESYWSMVTERRIELGVPADLDNEIFDAIGELVRAQEERLLNTDSSADAETETEMVDVVAESGSKKQRRGFMPPTSNVVDDIDEQEQEEVEELLEEEEEEEEEKEEEGEEEEEKEEEGEEDDQGEDDVQGEEDDHEGEDAQKDGEEEQTNVDKEGKTRTEGKEGTLAAKLREKADLINAILKGKMSNDMDCKLSELRNIETSKLDYTRRQGDKLIACFGDLVKTLKHFSDLVQSHK